jgi:geranylgeranyl pyrophosphate synthase
MVNAFKGPQMDEQLAQVSSLMASVLGEVSGDVTQKMASEHLAGGGKRLRARLAIAATKALGGSAADALVWAAACELLHNGTLVHDDLQDGDRVRRDQPTVWARYGMEQAVNVGDFLLIVPYLALGRLEADGRIRWELARALAEHTVAAIRGQALEFESKRTKDTRWSTYERVVTLKTSALFELPAHGAAVLSGLSRDRARKLSGVFHRLGLLFQMQDDVLDLFGNKGRGSVGSDIAEGKLSALVVEHLALVPSDGPWLLGVLQLPREQTSTAEITKAIDRFRNGGAFAAVLANIHHEAAQIGEAARAVCEPALAAVAHDLVETVMEHVRDISESSRQAPQA